MTTLHVPVHSYRHRSRPASSARLLNCYAEILPPGARTPVLLTRAPGITSWTTVASGSIGGMHAALGYLFVVSGSKFCRVDSSKTVTVLGDIGPQNKIDIDSNTDSVVVVNEPNAYYWDGTTFGQINDTDFTARGAGDVEFLDNYLLFREPDSGRFFGADLGSATSFDSLNFATAEGSPDLMNGMKVDHRQAVLSGTKSMEIWQNTGASGFPFERAINGYVEQGCLNGKTLQKVNQSLHWVADDYTVRRLEGITPVRISTHAIEQALSDTTIAAASAFSYSQDGHIFYIINTPEGAFAYDATTNEWAERRSYGYDTWNIKHHAQAFGLELVGDGISNKVGYFDPASYQEFSSIQRMEWTYQPVYAEGRRAFHDRLEIVLESGVGLTTGQGSDPQIMLEISDDGGRTWDAMPNRALGDIGEYLHRVIWHNLGSSHQRVYRCAISDPVKVVVTDTLLEVRGGRL